MRFLMFVCGDESAEITTDPDPRRWLAETPQRIEGDRLRPVSDATTLWPKEDGGTFVSDGPFAETKEQIGGYDIIECADLAEAIEIAARHPVAAFGAIELRPIWT
jgi:hypothetical protein